MGPRPITSKARPTQGGTNKPKTKFTPKPASSKEERLKKLNAGLVDQIEAGYLDKAIKQCRTILHHDPTSLLGFKTLLFLLLQTDQYLMGFQSFDEYPSEKLVGLEGNATPFAFEKAYCLYRLHQEDKALQLIQSALEQDVEKYGYENDDGRRVGHLKGQILYRSGRFQEAEQVYNDLLASCPADSPETPDIINNLDSVRTHLEFQQTGYHSLLDSAQLDYDAIEQDVPALPTIVRQTADAASSKTGSKGASGGVLGEEGSKGVVGGASTSASGSAGDDKAEPKNKKPAHKLPKGAVAGQAFEEDPDRWLPLAQRRSYQAQLAQNPLSGGSRKNKKGNRTAGGKEISGLGTQGSMNDDAGGSSRGGGGSGGNKGKKGRKGR